jgi:PAS domain S-box-containing protein
VSDPRADIERLFALSSDLLCITDARGRLLRLNPAWEKLGYTLGELLDAPLENFLHPDDVLTTASAFFQLGVTINAARFAHRFRCKDGSYRWLNWHATLDPETSHVYAVVRESMAGMGGERAPPEEAERQLSAALQTNELYRQLFETSNSMVAIADFDGYFRHVNPVWTRVLGYSHKELCDVPFLHFVHPEDIASTLAEAHKLLGNDRILTSSFVNRYRCKDGSYRWLSWNAATDPATRLIYAIAHDISDLIETRERLQHSEELLQETSHIAKVGGWEFDPVTLNPVWSEEVYRIHEVPSDQAPTLEEAINFFASEARPIVRRALAEAIAEGKPFDLELPLVTLSGKSLWVRATCRPERLGSKVVRVRGTLQDISDQKAAERVKSEFISVVSHELRTPLTSIRGSLRLIEGGVMGELPAEAMDLVHMASSNCERLLRLINDILDLDKTEAGKLRLRLEYLELGDVVERAVRSVQGLSTESGVVTRISLAPLSVVEGDLDRLVQVLTNLLSNAIKFSPPGSEVRIQGGPGREGRVRLSVSDQGPGIPHEEIPRLFGKFQQLDSSDTRTKGGTGLGLAISKAIVEQHGGEIGVESEVGKGTVFWFELPSVSGLLLGRRRTRWPRRDTPRHDPSR